MYLPEEFEAEMQRLLGDEYEAYLACYEKPRYYGLRVNTKKISVEEFVRICPFEIRPVPWIENGFYYDGEKVSPAKHPYYYAGLYYLQEPSAMTPANRLPIEPGDRVLDLCAAPGGKATELGARLGGKGLLAANDISSSRAKGLLKNVELFGIGNVMVLSEEPGKLAGYFPEYFDKILIDAPCSGEGMFRKDRKMIKAWEEHGPEFFSKLQKNIVLQAAKMLRPGGYLLYSTCTFNGLENEGTVGYLLEECPEFTIEEIQGYEGFSCGRPEEFPDRRIPDMEKTVRIFPHRMQGEGHFIALLKKGADTAKEEVTCGKQGKRTTPEELAGFLEKIHWERLGGEIDVSRVELRGGRVYYMPEGLPDLKGLRFLRTGLLLGEMKKNRFEPGQALAMFLDGEVFPDVLAFAPEDERVLRYLRGETLDVEELVPAKAKGWYLVCVDRFPLGWGKVSSGVLKNKYLPGWRMQY